MLFKRFFVPIVLVTFFIPQVVVLAAPTQESINKKYNEGQEVKILIVPGHDDEFSGARFNGIREADRTLILAKKIATDLDQNPGIIVTLARTEDGYIPELQDYFDHQKKRIERFVARSKLRTNRALESGAIEIEPQVPHSDAPKDAALRLYGINLWADEHEYDLVVHVHFNDYGPRSAFGGDYDGYAVYVPEGGLLGAVEGEKIGNAIANHLSRTLYKTNMPSEVGKSDSKGVIKDFKLIALGANRTLATPSVLIEYAYLYETMMADDFFESTSNVMRRATVAGIMDYITMNTHPSKNITYVWNNTLRESKKKNINTLMLQLALADLHMYPPKNFVRAQCPFIGIYGKCTKAAVKEFQAQYDLAADGVAGQGTLHLFNTLFQ